MIASYLELINDAYLEGLFLESIASLMREYQTCTCSSGLLHILYLSIYLPRVTDHTTTVRDYILEFQSLLGVH